jgi:alpha-beta hydrolase superfamily lysophospholipase
MMTISTVRSADGAELALRRWKARSGGRSALFYIHGLQSHSGWLTETASALTAEGITVYSLDRRGSGTSGGLRGHLPSADSVIDDYGLALEVVRKREPGLPLTIVGQSFGASILAAICVSTVTAADSLVFCAPALGQQHARHDVARLDAMRRLTGTGLAPVGLADSDYTDEPRYLDIMAADGLMLRCITHRTRATMVALEDRYLGRPLLTSADVFLASPVSDPIIDLAAAITVLGEGTRVRAEREFNTTRHYIEFTSERFSYWRWLGQIALGEQCGRRDS